WGDLRAALLVQHDIAFARELPQRFADGRTRNSVRLADLDLIEIGAGGQGLRQNPPPQIQDAGGFPYDGVHCQPPAVSRSAKSRRAAHSMSMRSGARGESGRRGTPAP